jgi:hypothetical protein
LAADVLWGVLVVVLQAFLGDGVSILLTTMAVVGGLLLILAFAFAVAAFATPVGMAWENASEDTWEASYQITIATGRDIDDEGRPRGMPYIRLILTEPVILRLEGSRFSFGNLSAIRFVEPREGPTVRVGDPLPIVFDLKPRRFYRPRPPRLILQEFTPDFLAMTFDHGRSAIIQAEIYGPPGSLTDLSAHVTVRGDTDGGYGE